MQPSSARSFSITPSVRKEIVKIIDDRIAEAHVTKEDFSELKSIVKDLATEQKQTATALKELTVSHNELAAEVKQIAATVKELVTSQKEMQIAIKGLTVSQNELAASQKEMHIAITKLTEGLNETRIEVGGLSRSMSYAFENETYRFLPAILEQKYGLKVQEKIVRADIGGKEVNLFCRAEREGKEILIVGEAKLRLDEKRLTNERNVFDELEEKTEAVRTEYGEEEIVKVLVTHFATKVFLSKAKAQNIIVVQSHEW